MRFLLLLLLGAFSLHAQTEKWSYTIPVLPGSQVSRVDVIHLTHDTLGNVALGVRYGLTGGGGIWQVRWIAANGKEIAPDLPTVYEIAGVGAVSASALVVVIIDPGTGAPVLRKFTRKGKTVTSRDTPLGVGDEVHVSYDSRSSPTGANFFVERRSGDTSVSIVRYSVR